MEEQTKAPTMELARSAFASEAHSVDDSRDESQGTVGAGDSAAVMVGIARDRAQLALAAELRENREYFATQLSSMMQEVGSKITHPRNRFDF